MTDALYQALKAMEGEVSEPRKGNDDINKAMIRHWCEALEIDNPLYSDEAYAKASEYGNIIMPPTMVQAHCTPVLWPETETPVDPIYRAVQKCVESGYPGTVGVTMAYEFFQPMYPGDEIFFAIQLVGISPQKTTRLGTGYFLTSKYAYTNQKNDLITEQYLTVFQYKETE